MNDRQVLLAAESIGFDWLIISDKRIPYQQNLLGRKIAVLVLPTPDALKVAAISEPIRSATQIPACGVFVISDEDGAIVGTPAAHLLGESAKQT